MTPAHLFVELYLIAEQWPPTQRTLAELPPAEVARAIGNAVQADSGSLAYQVLETFISRTPGNHLERGVILAVLHAINLQFARVHPRVQTSLPGAREPVPLWLETFSEVRCTTGTYLSINGRNLIPNGCLSRGHRHMDASYADSLADRFGALALAHSTVSQAGRRIAVKTLVIGTAGANGVPPGGAAGSEMLMAAPIAENAADLTLAEHAHGHQRLVDYNVSADVGAATRLLTALTQSGAHDIAIAPELVMPEHEVEILRDALLEQKVECRLIIAGSGASEAREDELPWNQSSVLNARGAKLWDQRKVWPAGINSARAVDYGLKSEHNGLRYERTASGSEVVVADIDRLGRCLVLICQDLEATTMAEELVTQYQPDWVFTPILDPAIDSSGWAHQRAFMLSGRANTRFVVCTSTALPANGTAAYFLLAVGPKTRTDHDQSRRFHLVGNQGDNIPGWGCFAWDDVQWQQTNVQGS